MRTAQKFLVETLVPTPIPKSLHSLHDTDFIASTNHPKSADLKEWDEHPHREMIHLHDDPFSYNFSTNDFPGMTFAFSPGPITANTGFSFPITSTASGKRTSMVVPTSN